MDIIFTNSIGTTTQASQQNKYLLKTIIQRFPSNGYYSLEIRGKPNTLKKVCEIECEDFRTKDGTTIIQIFNEAFKQSRIIKKDVTTLNTTFIRLLDTILTNGYFGSKYNRKQFYYLVKKILSHTRHECVYLSSFYTDYKYEDIPWLSHIKNEAYRQKCLLYFNVKLMDFIVKPLIAHYFCVQYSPKSHKVTFIPRSNWQRFLSVNRKVLLEKHLTEVKLSSEIDPITVKGPLKITPKGSYDSFEFRPILNTSKYKLNYSCNYFRRLAQKIKKCSAFLYDYGLLYESWRDFLERNKIEVNTIFGVKLDIKDAFGSVNLEELKNIIMCNSNFSDTDKAAIIDHLTNQYISIGRKSRIYKWKYGLLQGDQLSSALSDLYISYQENMFFKEFKLSQCFIHRTVDDYMFCSVDPYYVNKFKSIITSLFEINKSKTIIKTTNIKGIELEYAGRFFCLDTGDVRKIFPDSDIRNKFKIWNINRPIAQEENKHLLIRAMLFQYNNNVFTKFELNTQFNSEETVIKNIFYGFIFTAFKFDCATMAIKDYNKTFSFLKKILKNVIRDFSRKIYRSILKYKGPYFKCLEYSLVVNIACKAFILVFKKRSLFYSQCIEHLQKKNCIHDNLSNRLKLSGVNIEPIFFCKMPDCFRNISMKRVPYV